MSGSTPEIADISGLWQRSLIEHSDGTRDTTTWVAWMQGPSLFADLRIPAAGPSFDGVDSHQMLTREHVAWLARQEAFAGRLVREDSAFVWHRLIDFQQPSALADAGFLRMLRAQDASSPVANSMPGHDGDLLIEDGRDVPYVEHWHRGMAPRAGSSAVRLSDLIGSCQGLIVRCSDQFMYARSRPMGNLGPGRSLGERVAAAPSLQAARDLVDCEVSFGSITADGWIIARSSLPYRAGARFDFEIEECGPGQMNRLISHDGDDAAPRVWSVVECEGWPIAG